MSEYHVLIVDDQKDQLSLFKHILQTKSARETLQDKVRVYTASNSYEAKQAAGKRDLTAAFFDKHLGKEDGLELCKDISETYHVPGVIMSGEYLRIHGESKDVALDMLRANAIAALIKPFEISEFYRAIKLATEVKQHWAKKAM